MTRREWLCMSGAAAAGCRGARKKRVAVIPKSLAHIFWVSVEAGARKAADESGIEILWNGPPSESEYSRQIQIVDSMIARHVDGIALAAAERTALVAPVDRAMAAGIPVTVFDSGLESENYTSYVGTDNYAAGKMGGRVLGQLLQGSGRIAILMHAPGSQSTMDRERGCRDALAAEFPRIKVVAEQFGMADRSKSLAAAENILAAHPALDGFFASTEPSSTGISLALKARGLAGKLKFVAFDWADWMIDDMKAGVIHAMVVQDPFKMGYETVKTLAIKLSGQTPPKRIDLPGIVVTPANLEAPEIHQLLHPGIKKTNG
ncbi:MAG: substrate-binding domain-containing protein [Bryobacterales bacterium]|nr:substrate-binding domain-containing protein [Bryobacterales bacterium]